VFWNGLVVAWLKIKVLVDHTFTSDKQIKKGLYVDHLDINIAKIMLIIVINVVSCFDVAQKLRFL